MPGRVAALGLSGILWAASAAAQPQGRVYDVESGSGIDGARVAWSSGERTETVFTASSGVFQADSSWMSGGVLVFSALGYQALELTWSEAAELEWQVGLDHDPLALNPIVVTVARGPRRHSEVAIPVETLGVAELHAAGAPSVDRLLGELPSVQVTAGTPTGSNLAIRGIGGARVLLLIDGRPAPGSLIENRDLSRMSLVGVERVEVVKGPLSSLYGSDALGGVVNVITRPATAGFRVDGRMLGGSAGRRQADVTVSGGGRLRYRAVGGWRQEEGMPGQVSSGTDAFTRVWDFRSDLRLDASESWDVAGGLGLLRERQRWPVGSGFSGFNDNTGLSGWLESKRSIGAGEWRSEAFVQDYEHLYRSARGDAPIATERDAPQWEREAILSTSYSAAIGGHRIDVGVEGSRRTIQSPGKLIEERVGDSQLALFAQDAWHLSGTVVSAGARLGWNSRWGSNLSPTIGLTRTVGEQLLIRTAVAKGFRAPSFKELTWHFANLGGGYILQGFSDLLPERSWSVSGGIEWNPLRGFRLDTEVYSNRVSNLIEFGFVGHAPSGLSIYSPRNLSDVTTTGLEVGIQAVSNAGEIVAGYAYLDARSPQSDTPLDRRPTHSGRIRASWNVAIPTAMKLNLTAHMTGEAPIVAEDAGGRIVRTGTQGRFTAVDVHASVEVWPGLEATIGVDNLLDARPENWQGLIERRVRVGISTEGLFGIPPARSR